MPLSRPANPKTNPTGRSIEPAEKPQRIEDEPVGPRVSVIIVAFNQAPSLRRAIEALEQSKDRDRIEILVVDCGSQDESSTIDADFPSINMLRLPHHLGAARAMNIGTRTAKADLVLYLSPEVAVQPNTIGLLADALEPDNESAAACPLLVNPEGHPVSRVYKLPSPPELVPAQLELNQESISIEYPALDAILVRKQFVRSMNYFDERYGHYWADADFAMQARRAGKKIKLIPSIRATYYDAPDPLEGDSLAEVDRITGAAAFIGKYRGFGEGLTFRLSAALKALTRFDLPRMAKVLAGQKLDGSQAG